MIARTVVLCALVFFSIGSQLDRPPRAAAPRIIMIYGGGLEKRITLTEFHDVVAFWSSVQREIPTVPAAELANRKSYDVALFWYHPYWEPYAQDSAKLVTLSPDSAEQHGILYASGAAGIPVFVFKEMPGVAASRTSNFGPRGIELLKLHGVNLLLTTRPVR